MKLFTSLRNNKLLAEYNKNMRILKDNYDDVFNIYVGSCGDKRISRPSTDGKAYLVFPIVYRRSFEYKSVI